MVKKRTLLMLIWAKVAWQSEFTLVGQAHFKLQEQNWAGDECVSMSANALSNEEFGVSKIILTYSTA